MRRAFTVIEALVIIAILCIVAAIVVPVFARKSGPPLQVTVTVRDRRTEYVNQYGSRYYLVTDHGDYQVSQGNFMAVITGHVYRLTGRGRWAETVEPVE